MHAIDANDLISELECFDQEAASNHEKLKLAQASLYFAIGLMEEVAGDTRDAHAKAYVVDHLKIMASRDHGFLSRDFNLDQWIEQLDSGENEDADQ